MPSHLTRVVFRNILANKPILNRGCIYRAPRLSIILQNGVRIPPQSQRRSFFNLFKPQRKIKPMELPPGLETLSDLAYMQQEGARLPPPEDVATAFNAFFARKDARFEDFHIELASNAFTYLREHPKEDGQDWLRKRDIDRAFQKLTEKRPDTGGEPHLVFGRKLHEESKRIRDKVKTEGTRDLNSRNIDKYRTEDLPKFVQLLTMYDASLEARDIVAENYRGPIDAEVTYHEGRVTHRVWTAVFEGLVREDKKEELLKTVDIVRGFSLPFMPGMQKALVTFFVQNNDLEQAKRWYLEPVFGASGKADRKPASSTSATILQACAIKGDLSFGQQVVASLLENIPNKGAWDSIFVWSAGIGKGVDEIDRMMNVMVRRNDEERKKNPEAPILHPDIDTINALVEFCIARNDPYSAERYISLGEKRGILPNAKTFTMQMEYRLSIKDIDGARAAYFNLQGNMSGDERSVKVVNNLIRALCDAKQHHFDDIMAIVDDLHERKAAFAPKTIAALCVLHLRRGETHDAIDLLQVHAHHFSPPQRTIIRDSLAAYIVDGQTSTADAWDTYQMLRNTFPETPRETRISIMNEFFARQRSDMACHVFFHMRNHVLESISANKDVYIAAFTGFARNADAESLELAHNQLKLDLHVELDTKMRNALMLAYAATGKNKKALEYWTEIGASKEGPTYNSIAIAFRACEGMPFGDEHAKSIWRRLKEMDIDIDKQIFTAYLSAIARNHLHDEALALIESVEEEFGFTPDLYILGNWVNTTTNIEKQAQVEQWIKQRYPDVWSEIEALGHWVTMEGFGYKQYNINRNLDP